MPKTSLLSLNLNEGKSERARKSLGRAAYIFHPEHPTATHLYTMPFAEIVLEWLAKRADRVDLHTWEGRHANLPYSYPSNVRIVHRQSFRGRPVIHRLAAPLEKFSAHVTRGYDLVIACGQPGVIQGAITARSNRCPLVYVNDEFPSHSGRPHGWEEEKVACQSVGNFIMPCASRVQHLAKELGLTQLANVIVVPNGPRDPEVTPGIDWHQRLGIPATSNYFVLAGTISDWICVPEILTTAPLWPDRTALVINSRTLSRDHDPYRNGVKHLDLSDRIYWNHGGLPAGELHSLIQNSVGSICLYRYTYDPSISLMGMASGKLLRSVMLGRPVIASRLESLAFVEEHGLGALIDHPMELPAAMERLRVENDAFSERCLHFSTHHLKTMIERAENQFDQWLERTLASEIRSH